MKFKYALLLLILFMSVTGCEAMHDFFFGDDDHSYHDRDGIPDKYEQPGMLYNGLPLYDWGARPEHADIFIHVSTMAGASDSGMLLQKAALDKVVAAFAAQNIAVHFDVGTTGLYDQSTPVSSGAYNLGNKNYQIPYYAAITLAPNTAATKHTASEYNVFVDDLKKNNQYFPSERGAIFYYMVLGSSQLSGSSGIAWVRGTEFLITFGGWSLSFSNSGSGETNKVVNYQASTIMHELGHCLGLLHGGNESENYKPNYVSIMNYLYQLSGLPSIGNDEGDRYYQIRGQKSERDLNNSPYTSSFRMDYSHGKGDTLDENYLVENKGLMQPHSMGVDWNLDGDTRDYLKGDINSIKDHYASSGITKLKDYNDWDHLFFYYEALQNGRSAYDLMQDREFIIEDNWDFSNEK